MQCAKRFSVILFQNRCKNIFNIEKNRLWIINSRQLHLSNVLNEFHEYDKRSGYDTGLEISNSRLERIRLSLKQLKKEIKLWKKEMKETLEADPILDYRAGIKIVTT